MYAAAMPRKPETLPGSIAAMTGRLDGKVAIITGASTGLGPVLGAVFVREGAKVLLAARRAELVRDAAHAAGPGAIAMRADVTDENDVAAKAALRAFTKTVALEVGPHGIRCNCIVPGAIDTDLWRQWVQRTANEQGTDFAALRARMVKGFALQDISSPEDVANLALFLAGDESRTITGQSIPVDAGRYMQG